MPAAFPQSDLRPATPTDATRFILLGTSHPGNVGSAARAMKVMGFSDLVLVAPRHANVQRKLEDPNHFAIHQHPKSVKR